MQLGPLANELPAERRRARALDVALRQHAEHGGAARAPEDLVLCGCLSTLLASYHASSGWLSTAAPLPGSDEPEASRVESDVPVVDAHVHVFPDRVFDALWRWFERYAWPIRYKLRAPEAVRFLLDRGVDRLIALQYAHKPGMSRALNQFVAELARQEPRVIGFASVLPGEPGAVAVLEQAKQLGLRGVKLHCHVQAFAPDSFEGLEVFAACDRLELPVIIHAGREPKSPAYPVDPHAICAAARIERVVERFPALRVCVPHFGGDEFDAYADLVARYDNLYLDTTMVVGGFLPGVDPARVAIRPERVMYGTDFPNLPYAWNRELLALQSAPLSERDRREVLGETALRFIEGSWRCA